MKGEKQKGRISGKECLAVSWLPATTALSDEETDEKDMQEVKEDCLSSGRDDVEDLQATSSPPLALADVPSKGMH